MTGLIIWNREDIYDALSGTDSGSDKDGIITRKKVGLASQINLSDKQSLLAEVYSVGDDALYSGVVAVSSTEASDFSGYQARTSKLLKQKRPEFNSYVCHDRGLLIRRKGEKGMDYELTVVEGEEGNATLYLFFGCRGLIPRNINPKGDFDEQMNTLEDLSNLAFHDHLTRSNWPRDSLAYLTLS